MLRGSGRHELNHRDYALNENSLYLITPMDFHAVQVDPACELALYHVQFGCSVLDSEMMRRITRDVYKRQVQAIRWPSWRRA